MAKNKRIILDRDFQELAARVNNALIENDGLIGDQKAQVEKVFDLEKKFLAVIKKYSKTTSIYESFIRYIHEDLGNVLSAKSFFREAAIEFNKNISPVIKDRDAKSLMKFHGNYQLIKYIVDSWGPLPVKIEKCYEDFLEARRILIENNMPLAINRAKLFYRKTPKSHLNLLDLIDICIYGLVSGIDKYVGEYTHVWRSVCIGRMVGYMIEEYSKTFIRLYPSDKKILYRVNALKYRMNIENIKDLAKAVNDSFYKDKEEKKPTPRLPISEEHIRSLLNSTTYTSSYTASGDKEEDVMDIYDYTASPDSNVEEIVENRDTMQKIVSASTDLPVIERKIIKLKGVNV
jgi:DNA-directed RNA polymerase specialized sigma subunit